MYSFIISVNKRKYCRTMCESPTKDISCKSDTNNFLKYLLKKAFDTMEAVRSRKRNVPALSEKTTKRNTASSNPKKAAYLSYNN